MKTLTRTPFASATLAALLALSACVSSARPEDGPTEECPVCRFEGDLACVCVHVEADTPSCECAGETLYFCSEECRAAFLERPERYRRR